MQYRKLAIVAGIVAAMAATPAMAGPSKAVSVDASNYDLSTDSGFDALTTRVDIEAKNACDYKSAGHSLRKQRKFESCYSDVIEATAQKLGLEQEQQAKFKDALLS